MKKLFLIFVFAGIFTNSLNAKSPENPKPAENPVDTKISDQFALLNTQIKKLEDLKTQVSKDPSKVEKINSNISAISEKVKSLFNFVAGRIDTMLTKKGAITTLLILGPLFTAYCIFFTPEPIKKIITYICAWSTKGAVDVGTSVGTGVVEGAIQGAKANWWELLKLGGIASAWFTLMQIPTAIMTTAAPILIKLILLKAHVPLDKLK